MKYPETKKSKKSKGITLIALVITIIILLILAGITILTLTGENGLLNKANLAVEKTDEAQKNEEDKLVKIEDEFDNYTKITLIEQMLKKCGISTTYTIEDIVDNKDSILSTILNNKEAVEYIIQDSEELKAGMCNSEIAITELAKNENSKKQIINNEQWLTTIQNSKYASNFDEYTATIQKMTSNEGPGGTVTAVSTQEGSFPYYAFDEDDNTGWYETNRSVPNNELIYTYTDMKTIYKLSLIAQNITNAATDNNLEIYLSPSENEDDWIQIYNDSWYWGRNSAAAVKNVNILLEKLQKVKRIKIKSTCIYSGNYWTQKIKQVQAYGLDI